MLPRRFKCINRARIDCALPAGNFSERRSQEDESVGGNCLHDSCPNCAGRHRPRRGGVGAPGLLEALHHAPSPGVHDRRLWICDSGHGNLDLV